MNKAKRTEEALIITLATADAPHLQNQLLKAITAVFKHCLSHPVEDQQAAQAMSYLADLQLALLPATEDLEKISS